MVLDQNGLVPSTKELRLVVPYATQIERATQSFVRALWGWFVSQPAKSVSSFQTTSIGASAISVGQATNGVGMIESVLVANR
jgi:hypothetical protein